MSGADNAKRLRVEEAERAAAAERGMSGSDDAKRLRRRLALLAALAPPYYTAVATLATLFGPRGYSSTTQTMSQLAAPGTPRPWLINAGFAGYGLLVQGMGPLLHREAGGGRRGRMLWALSALYGLGGLVAAKYPTRGSKRALPGMSEDAAHDLAGTTSFLCILALSALTPRCLADRRGWPRRWRCFSYAVFAATAALALPFHLRIWPRKRGLLQRGFFATTMAWVVATALRLRRLA